MPIDPPTPRDEISSIAGRVLGRKEAAILRGATEYNALLADAKKLAGFALRSDTVKGSNKVKRQPRG